MNKSEAGASSSRSVPNLAQSEQKQEFRQWWQRVCTKAGVSRSGLSGHPTGLEGWLIAQ